MKIQRTYIISSEIINFILNLKVTIIALQENGIKNQDIPN